MMKTTGKTKFSKTPVFDAEGYQANLTSLNGTPLPDLSKVKARAPSWAGVRNGAGRKPPAASPCGSRLTPRQCAASAPPPANKARPSPTSPRKDSPWPKHVPTSKAHSVTTNHQARPLSLTPG